MDTTRHDPRRPRTRRAILDATDELLTARGIAHTSIADIAKRASVSVGSIYGHFGSKDLLLLSLVARSLEDHRSRFEVPDSLTAPLDRVLWIGDAWLSLATEHPVTARVLAVYTLEPPLDDDPAAQSPVLSSIQAMRASVLADLDEASSDGQLGGHSPGTVFTFLLATWTGLTTMVSRRDHGATAPAEARDALSLSRQLLTGAPTTAHTESR